MRKTLLSLGSMIILLGAGCSGASSPSPALPDLSFALPSDGSVTVARSTVDAQTLVDADALFAQATECGFARTADYYLDIENLFAGQSAERYAFTAAGDFAEPSTWTVTVMPDAPAYASTSSFKQDFDICAVGGSLYPVRAESGALIFSDSCGSGYQKDGETRAQGCETARKAVEPTIAIK